VGASLTRRRNTAGRHRVVATDSIGNSYSQAVPTAAAPRRSRSIRSARRMREMAAFGVVGAVCFLIDVSVFQVLYAYAGVDAVATKLLATLVSTTTAFLGHRYWSFAHRARTGLRREYVRFASINGLTLLLGLAIVWFVRYPLGQDGVLVLQGANVFAICVGTVVRFLAYSQWVFPPAFSPDPDAATVPRSGPDPGPRPVPSG
jgi:putative flippase GtrA